MKKPLAALILSLSLLSITAGAWAQGLPTASPEQVGLSSARLDRIAQMVKADVEKGSLVD